MSSRAQFFFPEVMRIFFRNRYYEFLGFCFILAALFTGLALWSYHASDPSLNTFSTSHAVENLMQIPGAYFADFVIQSVGKSFLLFPFFLVLWALRYLRHTPPLKIFKRLLAAVIAVVFVAIGIDLFVSLWQVHKTMPALGYYFISLLKVYGPGKSYLILASGLSSLLFSVALAATLYALDLENVHLRVLLHSLLGITSRGFSHSTSFFNDIRSRRARVVPVAEDTYDVNDSDDDFIAYTPAGSKSQNFKKDFSAEPDDPLDSDELTDFADAPLNQEPHSSKESFEDSSFQKTAEKSTTPQKGTTTSRPTSSRTALKLSDASSFELPSLDLLQEPDPKQAKMRLSKSDLEENMSRLMQVLKDYGIKGTIRGARPGPVVTLYELEPAPGIKSARIIGLADDIARSMHALSARIAVVPGQNLIGIELPNEQRQTVFLKELLEDEEFTAGHQKLAMTLGKSIGGRPVFADLARMPHMIVAGTTGSGKSVGINAMILSLLYNHTPESCRLILIDPKMLEFSMYNDIPHLLTPVVTDPKKALFALKWAVKEMENRYRSMSQLGVRNIESYNEFVKKQLASGEPLTKKVQTGFDPETGRPLYEEQTYELKTFPYIVVVVDEMADLMMVAGKDIEAAVQRLAQMARAAGIHVIMATQRPSVDVITGTIKANFPTRISFQVTSKFDSRTILGEQGAEQLLGRGDMLFMESGGRIQRIHGPFVSDQEVERVVSYLKTQGSPQYSSTVTDESDDGGFSLSSFGEDEGGGGDQLYRQAIEIVRRDRKASTSYLQRKLAIGYNRAARLVEQMENDGLISPANHVGKREVLMDEDN